MLFSSLASQAFFLVLVPHIQTPTVQLSSALIPLRFIILFQLLISKEWAFSFSSKYFKTHNKRRNFGKWVLLIFTQLSPPKESETQKQAEAAGAMDHLSGHEGEIPLPISSTYVVHHPCSTRPLSSTVINNSGTTEDSNNSNNNSSRKQLVVVANNNNKSTSAAVRYRECLKNHAASMGGTVTDGCGEFMPSGEEGSLEALKCSACSCHRNFHRKEVEGEAEPPSSYHHELYHYYKPTTRYLPTTTRPQPPPALIMPLGAIHTSESDEMEDVGHGGFGGEMMRAHQSQSQGFNVKKRFRTKFTQEQKEKMLGFAERVGWKLQRTEEGSVQQFCQEIGIKRRVLKVWMHNNKHNLQAKMKTTTTTTSDSVTIATD